MKIKYLLITFFIINMVQASAQEVIRLYKGKAPGSEKQNWVEQEMKDPKTRNRTLFNVTDPTVTVYKPEPGKSNGSAVIICAGGAFHVLDIDNEGYNVAKWFAQKGFTAFVLKYRLLYIDPKNPMGDVAEKAKDFAKFEKIMDQDVPLAIADGNAAMAYIKSNAAKFKIDPTKIGIIGFSAGGTIAAGLAYSTQKDNIPAFAATIYPYLEPMAHLEVPADAPPLFISVAEDDTFGFDADCLWLYKDWKKAGKNVDLHIYSKGSHGFGTKIQNLPVDRWMDPLANWLKSLGY